MEANGLQTAFRASALEKAAALQRSGITALQNSDFVGSKDSFLGALALFRSQEAVGTAEPAVSEVELLRLTARASTKMGELQEAEHYYRMCLDQVRSGTDAKILVLLGLAGLNRMRGELSAAVKWAKRATDCCTENQERLKASALFELGSYLGDHELYEEAEAALNRSRQLFNRLEHQLGAAQCHVQLSLATVQQGASQAALAHARTALMIAAEQRSERLVGQALSAAARVYEGVGRTERAAAYRKEAAVLLRQQGAWYELECLSSGA
jgi:tetratricopeptide (TPR) repeat protein